ncbi:hypothetical protein CH296_26605 [Rhodococcus sp. 14-2496-1d]|uniref:HpcH/HpaI aldolase/citrate lyase family protein n=1 Tax=Rhodococcus sp. 14-2496-1d TaxID=2023146 RepID=UPI000B9B9BCF|nr:CoA ester lyase [Rhodococcus sp. 14-2496-1d]OZF25689.1 hypothetical protein CH296_26605 [Rhodococcus sp. 14-2496-1d]
MTSQERVFATTLLYCPAIRPERFSKALAASEQIIVDLEDSVLPDDKNAARRSVDEHFTDGSLTADRVIVRINGTGTEWYDADVELCRRHGVTVMLPKAEDPQQFRALAGLSVAAICETPLGVANAGAIAREVNCVALHWGGEDLTAALGGRSSRRADGTYLPLVQYVRPHILLAAGAAGKPAIDGAFVDLQNSDGLREETTDAVLMGYSSKIALHPKQIPVILDAFRPSADELDWAVSLLAESAGHDGAFTFRGRMVDAPLLQQARSFVAAGGMP